MTRTPNRWRVRKVRTRWFVQRAIPTSLLPLWWVWGTFATHAEALAHADAEARRLDPRRRDHQRDYTLAAGRGRLA